MDRRVLSSKDSVRPLRNRCEFERTNESPNTYHAHHVLGHVCNLQLY